VRLVRDRTFGKIGQTGPELKKTIHVCNAPGGTWECQHLGGEDPGNNLHWGKRFFKRHKPPQRSALEHARCRGEKCQKGIPENTNRKEKARGKKKASRLGKRKKPKAKKRTLRNRYNRSYQGRLGKIRPTAKDERTARRGSFAVRFNRRTGHRPGKKKMERKPLGRRERGSWEGSQNRL